MTDRHSDTSAVEEQEINVLELVQVLVKRRMLILKTCAVVMAGSLIYSLIIPNTYSATAKVLPPQKESMGGLSALLSQAGGGGLAGLAGGLGGSLGGGADLYLGILKSRSVQDAVIRQLNLTKVYETSTMDETRRRLEDAVKMQAGKDGIISVTAEDEDPKRSALMANALVDALARTTVRLNLSKAGTERSFLEKRLDLVKVDLKKAEEDLKSFSQRNKIVQVDAQTKASIEGVARMKAEVASKEVQLTMLRSRQTDESPEVQALESGMARLKAELGQLTGAGGTGVGIPAVGSVPGIGLEYARKMREFKTQEAIFELLTKQYEMAKLNEAKDTSTVQVLDEAVVPVKKSKPARALIVLFATGVAFFASVLTVLVQEALEKLPAETKEKLSSLKRQAFTAG